jgi:hypothetical protein
MRYRVAVDEHVIVILAFTALCAGTVDAIAGGGGLITLPALLAAGLSPEIALGTNKGQSVWGSGSALIAFARARLVDGRHAAVTFPLGFVGALLGAQLVLQIDRNTLRPIVIALLIAAAVLLVVKKPAAAAAAQPERAARYRFLAGLLALAIGTYDGFFGPGTGTFLIVGFMLLCAKPATAATADAKVVNFASNLASVLAFAHAGTVAWSIALPMAAGQLIGGVLGARLAIRGGAALVRAFVVAVSGALIIKLAVELLA